jgi:hypothetical protein
LPMRIVQVAVDACFQCMLGGAPRAARLVRERAGGAFDPEVAACLADAGEEILAFDEDASAWEQTLACEPPGAHLGGWGDRPRARDDGRVC